MAALYPRAASKEKVSQKSGKRQDFHNAVDVQAGVKTAFGAVGAIPMLKSKLLWVASEPNLVRFLTCSYFRLDPERLVWGDLGEGTPLLVGVLTPSRTHFCDKEQATTLLAVVAKAKRNSSQPSSASNCQFDARSSQPDDLR